MPETGNLFGSVEAKNDRAADVLARRPRRSPPSEPDHFAVENRKALDRQIFDSHFRGVVHMFRNIDAGSMPPEWQDWYVGTLDTLVSIWDQLPDFYKAAGIDHEVHVSNRDIDRAMAQRQAERKRA